MITQIKKTRLQRFHKIKTRYPEFGFTFIEVLATVVVVGIITVIAFSVYQGKRDEAKKTAAYAEMREMAEAEKMVEMYYGYYIPLAVLNDVPGVPIDYSGVISPDCIGNGAFSYNYYLIDPESGYAGSDGVNYASPNKQIKDLVPTAEKARQWKGPFVTFQRITTQPPQDPRPIDPWGNDYYLFTWRYAVRYDGYHEGFSSSSVDRFAIVSPGKNGWLDYTSGVAGDDVIYTFR